MKPKASPKWYKELTFPKGKKKQMWAIPVSWMLDQCQRHMQGKDRAIIFAVKDGELFVHAYRPKKAAKPASKAKAVALSQQATYAPAVSPGGTLGVKIWAEDWPGPKPGDG